MNLYLGIGMVVVGLSTLIIATLVMHIVQSGMLLNGGLL